jgi:hypothetical protein
MARGEPDYGSPGYTFFTVETPIADVVAAGLGFSRLDNRGRILLIEDFRGGLNRWILETDAGGADPAVVYEEGKGVGFYGSCKMDPLVNGGTSGIYTDMILPVSTRLGIECGIYLTTNFGWTWAGVQHNYNGITAKGAGLGIVQGTGEVGIDTEVGWHSIMTPSSVGLIVNKWVSFKVVADFSTGKYVRAMIGNTEYDLSGYSLKVGLAGLVGDTFTETYVQGNSPVFKEEVYIGYVILSGDEP